MVTSTNGSPIAAIRRYVTAKCPVWPLPPIAGDDRHGGRRRDDQQREADRQREPESLAGYLVGIAAPARTVEARHLRGGCIAQEIEDAEERGEHRTGEAERRELVHAQVPDDRRVSQDVERLGRQRAERGQGDREDLPVVGRAAEDAESGCGQSPGSSPGPHTRLRTTCPCET